MGNQIERPGHGDGGGLVTGGDEGHQRVADIAVGQRRAGFLIPGRQKQAQQILARIVQRASALDLAIRGGAKHAAGLERAQAHQARRPFGRRDQIGIAHAPDLLEQHLDGGAHLTAIKALHVGKQRTLDHRKRRVIHNAVHIHRPIRAQQRLHGVHAGARHNGHETVDPALQEGRLQRHALAPPAFTVGGEDGITQNWRQHAQDERRFAPGLEIVLQDRFHLRRAGHFMHLAPQIGAGQARGLEQGFRQDRHGVAAHQPGRLHQAGRRGQARRAYRFEKAFRRAGQVCGRRHRQLPLASVQSD